MLACVLLALAACSGGAGPRIGGPATASLECVPYAREVSGIRLYGDAASWWEAAAGQYDRTSQPLPGAVLVFRRTGRLPHGHVSPSSPGCGPRGRSWSARPTGCTAASPAASPWWTSRPATTGARCACGGTRPATLGTTTYPTFGFIAPAFAPRRRPCRRGASGDVPVRNGRIPLTGDRDRAGQPGVPRAGVIRIRRAISATRALRARTPKMTDYRDTVFLPTTPFPMRGDLPAREPDILARWERIGLWARTRQAASGRSPFVLHDGPIYSNGNLHIGHALNRILKDVVMRAHRMAGFDADFIPGWDCHGLPIEWKVEEEYRRTGRDKDAVPVLDFRAECRAYSQGWLEVQTAEFKRLGVTGDWAGPLRHHGFPAEAAIAGEIGKPSC